MRNLGFCAAAALLATATGAQAAQLVVSSYDTPNGSGTASGGSFNYWDKNYNGSGATTTDGAALSGGTGDLTDGYSETLPWYSVENGAGTGPYVGWRSSTTANPTVTFHFASPATVNSIAIAMDNSGVGGVSAPSQILVDGIARAFTAPTVGTAGISTISGLNLTGSSHTVEFDYGNAWIFVSEVDFFGRSALPEPATWAMMILGIGAVGFAMRRRPAARLA